MNEDNTLNTNTQSENLLEPSADMLKPTEVSPSLSVSDTPSGNSSDTNNNPMTSGNAPQNNPDTASNNTSTPATDNSSPKEKRGFGKFFFFAVLIISLLANIVLGIYILAPNLMKNKTQNTLSVPKPYSITKL